jgi:hypothetical protein
VNYKIPQNATAIFCTGVCVLGALISGVAVVSQNLQKSARDKTFQEQSAQRHSDRARALSTVAKEHRIQNCWTTSGVLTVDRVAPTTRDGSLIPSSCVVNKDRSQYAYLAQYNGAMRMQFVFTQTEVVNQLSRI